MTKILVIEDERLLRGEVLEWLGFEGYEAIGAEDGVKGVEYALRESPDLIVCDITMPRLDGYDVLLEDHSNPATANVPFIFLTARAAHEDIRKGMSLGADDYVTKPFTRLELLQAIETRVQKKTAQEQEHHREIAQLQLALTQEYRQGMARMKMLAMFSHDFRNPLAAIRITNSLLRTYGGRIDEQRRLTYMERIDVSVRQLLQMLDDMLLVAQMETSQLEFKPESLDLTQMLQTIIEEFQVVYGDTHRILFESSFTEMRMADPRLLRQISANLISNAIKYSDQGSEVRVTLDNHQAGVYPDCTRSRYRHL